LTNTYFQTKHRVDWPYEVLLQTESVFTFLPYGVFQNWGGALQGFLKEKGMQMNFNLIKKGSYYLLKTDCSNANAISGESIYLRTQSRWLKHGLRVESMHGNCYLNFAADVNAKEIKVGVSFFKQHYIST